MTTSTSRVFIVDTSVWIRLHEECYPPDVFPGLYHMLQACARRGEIKSPRQVLTELGDEHRGGVGAWVRALQPSIVLKETPAIGGKVGEICTAFPRLLKAGAMEADPFVIAHALMSGSVVVTEESRSFNPNAKPKIPDVCDHYRVSYMKTIDMLRALQIKL